MVEVMTIKQEQLYRTLVCKLSPEEARRRVFNELPTKIVIYSFKERGYLTSNNSWFDSLKKAKRFDNSKCAKELLNPSYIIGELQAIHIDC